MRCVSKPWNAILSQPSFIKSHIHLHRSLIHKNNIVIKIWNPFLSAVSTLPTCDIMHFRFGIDPKTDDYKLVKLMHGYKRPQNKVDLERDKIFVEKNGLEVEVYSMKKGSWKLINDSRFPMHISMVVDNDKVYLHWLGYTFTNGAMEVKTIVSFDLGLETFSEISLPHSSSVVKENCSYNLGVLDGKLCVIMSCYKGYEIWVMNEYESWVKQHFISNSVIGINKGAIPFGFTLTNKCVCSFLLDDDLFLYDQIAGKSKSFRVSCRDYVKIVQYVESFDWIAP